MTSDEISDEMRERFDRLWSATANYCHPPPGSHYRVLDADLEKARRELRAAITAIEAERDAALAERDALRARCERLRNVLWDAGEDERLNSYRLGGYIQKHLVKGDWADPLPPAGEPAGPAAGDAEGGAG